MSRVNLTRFGYNSRAAFLRDVSPPVETITAISMSDSWSEAKSVLLHKACPLEIRERFAADPIWYKRITAIFAPAAPDWYVHKAKDDKDIRVRRAYVKHMEYTQAKAAGLLKDAAAELESYNKGQA